MIDTIYWMNTPVSLALLGDIHGKPYQTVTNSLRKHEFRGYNIKSILMNEVYVGDVQFGKHPSRNVITGELDEYQVKKYPLHRRGYNPETTVMYRY